MANRSVIDPFDGRRMQARLLQAAGWLPVAARQTPCLGQIPNDALKPTQREADIPIGLSAIASSVVNIISTDPADGSLGWIGIEVFKRPAFLSRLPSLSTLSTYRTRSKVLWFRAALGGGNGRQCWYTTGVGGKSTGQLGPVSRGRNERAHLQITSRALLGPKEIVHIDQSLPLPLVQHNIDNNSDTLFVHDTDRSGGPFLYKFSVGERGIAVSDFAPASKRWGRCELDIRNLDIVRRGSKHGQRSAQGQSCFLPCPSLSSSAVDAAIQSPAIDFITTTSRLDASPFWGNKSTGASGGSAHGREQQCQARRKGNESLGLTFDENKTVLLAQSAPWRPGAAAKRAKAVVQKSVGEKGAEGGSWVEVWFVWSENPWQHTVTVRRRRQKMQPMWTNAGHSRVSAKAVELVCAKTSPLSRLGSRGFAFFPDILTEPCCRNCDLALLESTISWPHPFFETTRAHPTHATRYTKAHKP